MRMLQPSPGEVQDRLSILELKVGAAVKRNLPTEHFALEINGLMDYLQNYSGLVNPEFFRLKDELMLVNKRLWECEDEIRTLPGPDHWTTIEAFRLATLCKTVADLNDCRAKLVGQINALFGITGQEKIYAERPSIHV